MHDGYQNQFVQNSVQTVNVTNCWFFCSSFFLIIDLHHNCVVERPIDESHLAAAVDFIVLHEVACISDNGLPQTNGGTGIPENVSIVGRAYLILDRKKRLKWQKSERNTSGKQWGIDTAVPCHNYLVSCVIFHPFSLRHYVKVRFVYSKLLVPRSKCYDTHLITFRAV